MLTVYIVDDSQVMRERLTESVADIAGVEIAGQSGDPFEALDSIKKSHPDVVILDIRLPQISGIDLLKDIKERPAAPIVIMITNYPYHQYRQACMAAGADYFFSKIDEFEMIRETLSRMGLHHQNQKRNDPIRNNQKNK
ncbi:MAG: response regulator transcription factor [Desulfobacterales bacterium]|jgi:two-component system response regulator DevR